MGVDVIFNWVSDGVIEGRSNDASNRLIFTLTVDTVTGHLEFDLNDQLDHPFHSTDDGNDLIGMWEELLGLNLSSVIVITDADGPPINLGELPAPVVVINVIDDTPIIVGEPEIRIVDEDDIKTPWSLGTEPLDGAGDGSTLAARATSSRYCLPTSPARLADWFPSEPTSYRTTSQSSASSTASSRR